jgi:hypothetical protein
LNLQLWLQVQALQALKVSFHSDEVDVNSSTLSKELPLGVGSKLRKVHLSMSSIHSIIHAILYRPLLASNIGWKYFSKILKNSRIWKFSRWYICVPPGLKGLKKNSSY